MLEPKFEKIAELSAEHMYQIQIVRSSLGLPEVIALYSIYTLAQKQNNDLINNDAIRIQHVKLSRLQNLISVNHQITIDMYSLAYCADGVNIPVRCDKHLIDEVLLQFVDRAKKACFQLNLLSMCTQCFALVCIRF